MKKLTKFLRDKTGTQTLEWAIIAAIVVLVAVLAYDELGAPGGLKAKLVGAATVGGVSLGSGGNGGGGGNGGSGGSGGNGSDNNGKGGGCGGGTGGGQGGGCKK